jgi:hypothetical protein
MGYVQLSLSLFILHFHILTTRLPLKFFCAGSVYLILSKAFPAHETFMDRAILGDDVDTDASESVDEASSQLDLDDKLRANSKETTIPTP